MEIIMKKMLFVFNPNSGKAQIKNSLLKIIQIFSNADYEVTVYPTKAALVKRFYDATAPGGYLFIGHSESLDKESCPFSYIEPAIYRKI